MQSFFDQEYTFKISGLLLVAILILLFSFLTIAFVYIGYLSRRLKQYQTPKFGFLGKPLYPLAVFAMLAGTVFYANNSFPDNKLLDIKASKTINAEIQTTIISSNANEVQLMLKGIPIINNKQWGTGKEKFDLIWELDGPTPIDEIELARSQQAPSSLLINLARGNYKLKLTIIYEGQSYYFDKALSF